MSKEKAMITEDKTYKPASPEMPTKRFFIETDEYRWVVYMRRMTIKETGTVLFRADCDEEGHAAYGLTANEALNDMSGIMLGCLSAEACKTRCVPLDSVRSYLDPIDAAREDLKVADILSRKPLLARILGL